MNPVDDARLIGMLRRVIRDCGKLYQHCGSWMVKRYPTLIEGNADQFVALMDDLHRGLLIKVYVTIVRADDRWTGPEKLVAAAMIEHLWGEELAGRQLREAATGLFQQADRLNWESLVAPFVRYHPLADSKAQVETIVMRLANLVAKCDGQTMPEESVALHTLQREIDAALHPAKPDETLAPLSTPSSKRRSQLAQEKEQAQQTLPDTPAEPISDADRQAKLAKAMGELDTLIGLRGVKERVRSYANFLRLQQERRDAGLTTMPISLHMSFIGNPGTGKTTVARIVGQILGAMGTLPSGHVVETDRSGLVAEYAGQTAPKTNKLCDAAIGGVLFIDEAYSLIDASGDDAYGREAIQTLLKRMEDDRDSMAVVLAGYCDEMEQMIRSNPGLSSRINTQIEFDDYSPADLGHIFESMCNENQYQLPSDARHRLLLGFHELYNKRDRHFGNGRLVRNAFEDTVRHLADRIAEVSELTELLLTKFTVEDISVPGLSSSRLAELACQPHRLRIVCQQCNRHVRIQPAALGGKIKCNKCEHVQHASWAEVSELPAC
ncbi:AAA family ATPase [Planctomycetes bacterium K23_9]|uniref:Stage V sporulation protein K n=1 Tax=Stieleria marina TaxID=1930275 RepID=A0A517P3H7_9BACT|nr:Stage V sporulation protein K [Planctomycetes bacterium K23_9]